MPVMVGSPLDEIARLEIALSDAIARTNTLIAENDSLRNMAHEYEAKLFAIRQLLK